MNEALMKVIGELSMRVHSLQRDEANAMKAAANHHEHGDYTRAHIARHAAHTSAAMANLYRQTAGILSGTWLPHPGDVRGGGDQLRLGVGLAEWSVPEGASVGQLHQWRTFVDEVGQETIRQKTATDAALRRAQATLATGQIPQEFLPQPDALTAAPVTSGWPAIVGTRMGLDFGEDEPTVGRVTDADDEHLTVEIDVGARAGETVRVDVAALVSWRQLDELPVKAPEVLAPRGYPVEPAIDAAPQADPAAGLDALRALAPESRVDPPQWPAPGVLERAASMAGTPDTPGAEPLIDPDCRDGKCSSCVGGPCEHECHQAEQAERGGVPAAGHFQPGAGADRAGAVDGGRAAGADGTASGTARPDVTGDAQDGAGRG